LSLMMLVSVTGDQAAYRVHDEGESYR
jgi:hypothetical protein